MLGGALGAMTSPVTGPVGPMAGRMAGGTAGNVAGGMGGDLLRTMMGTQPAKKMFTNVPQEAKEGAVASAFGEMLPGGFKLGKKLVGKVSADTGLTRGLSQLSESLTGQPSVEFRNLINKPRAILYRWMGGYKGTSRAWKGFTDVLEKKGIPAGSVEFGARETMSSIKNSILDTIDMAKATKNALLKRMPTEQLIKTIRGISHVIDDPATTHGWGEYKGLRQAVMRELASRGDDIAEAWKDVAASELSKSFHSPTFGLLPKLGGSTEKAQGYKVLYELRRMIPILLGATGAATHSGVTAGLGALFSPMIQGLPYAAAGAFGKALESPVVVSSGVKAIQKLREQMRDQP